MIRVAFDTWILSSQGMGCKNALYSPKKYHYSEILKLGGVLILLTFDTQSRKCPSLLEMFKGYSGPMGNFRIWSVQINFLYKVTLRIITYGQIYHISCEGNRHLWLHTFRVVSSPSGGIEEILALSKVPVLFLLSYLTAITHMDLRLSSSETSGSG